MTLSTHERETLLRLVDLYVQVKTLVLYSEEIDPHSKSNIQTIKEFRDAFDHTMAAFHKKLHHVGGVEDEASFSENIDKAIGHVFRAGFDALDGTQISLKEMIEATVRPYSAAILTEVLPNYWNLKREIAKIGESFAKHRAAKDLSSNIVGVIEAYIVDVDRLKVIHEQISLAANAFHECSIRAARSNRKDRAYKLIVRVAAGLIVGFVLGLLTGNITIDFTFGQRNPVKAAVSNPADTMSTE
jgi:hypothetical protein